MAQQKAPATGAGVNSTLHQFLNVVSHDLHGPLRQIISFSEILEDEEQANLSEEGRRYLRSITAAGSRMQIMLAGLLRLARVDSRGEQTFTSCDLNALAADAIEFLHAPISQSGATIDYSDLPTVQGDPQQLMTLLVELLQNAIQFARPEHPPRIHIESLLQDDPDCVSIIVRDNGVGFEIEYDEKIFEVFQRLDSGRDAGGVGIGLTLCRSICTRHGGRISATAEPGRGARLRLDLPRNPSVDEPPA